MTTLSIAIMAVPTRQLHVNKTVSTLERQCAQTCGRAHTPSVVMDTERKGPWWCWREAWLARRDDATHHVVLQDDVLPCGDLPETLLRIAEARPDTPVSGFLPRKSVEKAHKKGLMWVRIRRFLWGQCLMMPRELGDRAVEWIDAAEGGEVSVRDDWRFHDDVRLASFYREHGIGVFVTVPNVVEHIGDELGSVMGHNGAPGRRRARVWVGAMRSGADFDWSDLRFVRE